MSKPIWLEIAESDFGVAEIPGAASHPRILEYQKHTSYNAQDEAVSWCASALNCWLNEAGFTGTGSAAARSFLDWGVPVDPPVEGCIVVLSRGGNPRFGHVGLYVGKKPGLVKVLGGNQSDRVCYAWFPASRVLGYRMPAIA